MNGAPDADIAVFTEALRLPPEERDRYLGEACKGDAEFRRRVEALLQAYQQAGDFLGIPAAERPPKAAAQVLAVAEKPGDRIGHYKLLQQIGEGGGGVVYMAEQEEPVRRRVALKIIKPGMDTKSVIARFEAERQALALMNHPNIAKVFDAGATEAGRPYFVMELVRGVKITEYCNQHSLTTEERLGLFVQVCQAVQHAHQRGIIHRDIKPSNVLVTQSLEGVPMPMVIDFGVAKATTDQRLTDKTVFTAFEMLIGTPAYMSPEQAELSSVDVDTRTDIYSLGVLLYELLTSSTPFETEELLKAGLDEIRKVIREQEPLRPSTRLSKMAEADLTTVAQQRRSEPPRLIHTIRGDLDWIAMKAMEKDRTRRYETANGLASDVQRFLANEAVSARPPSKLYRFQKLVLRNRLAFVAIAGILLSLIAGLVTASWLFIKQRQAWREADAARRQAEIDKKTAESETAKSQRIANFLKDMFQANGLTAARGSDVAVLRDMLKGAMDRLGGEMTNHPEIAAELQRIIARMNQEVSYDPLREKKSDEAEDLLNNLLTPDALTQRQSLGPLTVRAEYFARCGRWREAASDAALALKYQPEDHILYHTLAPLLVASTNSDIYQQLCQKIIARFGGTADPYIADRMAKDCLILPLPGVDLHPIAAMANTAVTVGSGYAELPFFEVCKALAEYREGHFDEAIVWAQKSLQNPNSNSRNFSPHSQGEAYAVIAMANYQLNRVEGARTAMAKLSEIVENQLPRIEGGDLGVNWRDWIIIDALRKEARSLIEGLPAPRDDAIRR